MKTIKQLLLISIVPLTFFAYLCSINTYSHADSDISQGANTVSVKISKPYKEAVLKYIQDYKNDSSNTDQLTKDMDALHSVSFIRGNVIKDGTIKIKYTGNTINDHDNFKVNSSPNNALSKLSSDDINELQFTIVNAINQVRQQLGILDETGSITLNQKATDIAKLMVSNDYTGNVNNILSNINSQYGVDEDLVFNQSNTDFGDEGINQWIYNSKYIHLKTIKQFMLESYIESELYPSGYVFTNTDRGNNDAIFGIGKKILGISKWQMDNINNKGIKNSYFGVWENLWSKNLKNKFNMIFIPNTQQSFDKTSDIDGEFDPNTEAYKDFGNYNIKDISRTDSSNKQSYKKELLAVYPYNSKKVSTEVAKENHYHIKGNKIVDGKGRIVKGWKVKNDKVYDEHGFSIKLTSDSKKH